MRETEVEMLHEKRDLFSKGPISDILGTFRRWPVVGKKESFLL